MYSACRVGYPWPPCKRLYPRQKKGAPFRFRPKGRKLHIRFLLLPFPPETRFAELSGGSPRRGSGRRRRLGVPGVGAQKSRDGNAVTAFLASAQLPWRLSFPFLCPRKEMGPPEAFASLCAREAFHGAAFLKMPLLRKFQYPAGGNPSTQRRMPAMDG